MSDLKPPIDSLVPQSKSSSYLPIDSPLPDAGPSRRRSFLSTIFSHGRSRSADTRNDAPPSYDTVVSKSKWKPSRYNSRNYLNRPLRKESLENAFEILSKYDTVILLDDSGSMALSGSHRGVTRWEEAGQALSKLAEIAAQYDKDGIDIHFLNNRNSALHLKSSAEVNDVFNSVRPEGLTPTGERLDQILKPLLLQLETCTIDPDGTPRDTLTNEEIKRVNLIVITDGEATDSPKHTILDAARRLSALRNLCMIQLGIQFVQIGNDEKATQALKELDDDLHRDGQIRDIVDTTPYSRLNPITADGLIKSLLGGINRRIDEQKNKK
ncbi:hypothetical protein FB45DRAFT_799734 [Roridomyces roridus]|uniref:VWFA domain-containing protein n=1 Tax=Roridomyces roridus TaxID=1738132 RepID=A0AAD7BFR4_9AGAR|nr:hypothetical protein FB45DRAFT_799734 [Roridomyces roridus]